MPDDKSFSGDAAPEFAREAHRNLPLTETHQPDPFLQTSTGRMGAGGITVAAVVVAAIIGVVLYGLNDRKAA